MKLFGIAALALAASFAAAPASAGCYGKWTCSSYTDNSLTIKATTVQVAGSHASAYAKNGFYNKAVAVAPSSNKSVTVIKIR